MRLLVCTLVALGMLLSSVWNPQSVFAAECRSQHTYSVEWGDTLFRIATQFGSSTAGLMSLNGIADPNLILAGQVLLLESGTDCSTQGGEMHVVQRGETLWSIATRYGISVPDVAKSNGIVNLALIYSGQKLTIPATVGDSRNNQGGLVDLQLSTRSPVQGRILTLSLPAGELSGASGYFGPWPIRFFREGDRYLGLVGSYALAAPGGYSLTIDATDGQGRTISHSDYLMLNSADYGYEDIMLSPTKTGLLAPNKTASEQQRVAAVVTPVTQRRYWQREFMLPSGNAITSDFGTRRSYNGGPYNSYHGGVDFSSLGDSSILAPSRGRVALVDLLEVRGNTIIIDHGWGVYSALLHQSRMLVQVGDVVDRGQVIGYIGATGLVTGPHLHWEMYVGSVQVDPMQWVVSTFP